MLTMAKFQGLPTANGSIGMLSYDLGGIITIFKSLLGSSPWMYDIDTLEIPWREEKVESIITRRCKSPTEANGRLVFGLMTSDGNVNPHPPVRIALQKVKKALTDCGHEVRLQRSLVRHTLTVYR